jgi:transposase
LRRELTIIPAQYKITEHVQTVYSCRDCEKSANPETSDIPVAMVKALVPAPVIAGSGIASTSLVAHIANQKYTLALPLYRQEQEFNRNNLNISRQTMANWLIYVSQHWLVPIYSALKTILLLSAVLHADETSVQVLKEDGKRPEAKSYMWLHRTGCDTERPIVLYDYRPDRKHINAKSFLEGFSGYLHSDGYQAYHNLPSDITAVGCWAHLRRKFADILKSIPDYNKPGSLAMRAMEYCDKLFDLERDYAKLPADYNFKARHKSRLEKSKPIMDGFFAWVSSVYGKHIMATLKSNMGKSLAYALNQRVQLTNVLCDGCLELSNNRAERSIKPFVIGRKNWLFSNTENGADASAMFYSIIETAKENGLNPYEYLHMNT